MNKAEKQAAAESLRNEATVLRQTRENYKEARANIEEKLKVLAEREQTKSVIWQKQYQESLKQQLDTAIDVLSSKNYSNIHQYLTNEYENGFIGTMYSMQKQGIPLAMPIDQKRVVKMIETTGDNMKLSKKLYGNTTKLKNAVRREVSIGLASGESYEAVAGRLSRTMGVDYNKTIRIARTEGGRVQNSSRFDAMVGAKKNGADIVKQWDSTLDNVTRPAHRELDGQIRELDEMFEAEGQQAQHPHGFGVAWMDINCRCVVVQRARWAIDGSNPDFEDYTKWDRNAPIRISEDGKSISQLIDLSDAKNFNAFKARYKEVSNNLTQQLAAAQIGIEVLGSTPEVTSQIVYLEAATIEEAEQFVTESLGIPQANYKGLDVRAANALNESLTRHFNQFPELKDNFGFVGSEQEAHKLRESAWAEHYLKVNYDSWDEFGMPEREMKAHAEWMATKTVGEIGNEYAASYSPRADHPDKHLGGIYINEKRWSPYEYDKALDSKEYSVLIKFHPVGTDNIKSTVDHEAGHQIANLIDLENDSEFMDIYSSISREQMIDGLSEYATTNAGEFIAEAWSEYLNNPNPREYASKIGDLIERKYKAKKVNWK